MSEQPMGSSFKEFSEDTTLHGLRNCTRNSAKCVRVFWSLILAAAIAVLLYFLYGIVTKVTNPQMVTDTNVSFGQEEIPFPSVTICNFNQIRRSYARRNPIIKVLLSDWFARNDVVLRSLIADGQNLTALFPDIVYENSTYWSANLTTLNSTEIRDLFVDSVMPVTHMLYDVEFGDTKITAAEFDDYFKPVLTDMGLCYTFRGHSEENRRMVGDIGSNYGLRLGVYLGSRDYYFAPRITYEEGLVVLVHMEEEAPSMRARGIQIEPRASANIALTRHKYIYSEDTTDCVDTESAGFSNHFSGASYTREACMYECRAEYILNQCQCQAFTDFFSGRYCLSFEDMQCQNKATYNFSRTDDGRNQCDCPSACTEIVFKETVSNSRYFNPFFDQGFQDYIAGVNDATAQVVQFHYNYLIDTVRLSVFFRELSLTTTKQVPAYTVSDAWGDIGGVFGLCFGASLFTLLELSVFCVVYTVRLIRRASQRIKRIHVQPLNNEKANQNGDVIAAQEKNPNSLPPEYPKQFLK